MSTDNGNGDHAPASEAPDWHGLVQDPGIRLALITIEERGRDHANENRKGLKDVAKLAQDCCAVANMAYGEASRAKEAATDAKLSAERVEAALAISTKIQAKMAKTMGIETPDSSAPPPFRERFDSLQGEIDLAELAAAEARKEAQAAQARADVATTAAEAAKTAATGATKAAGEAKLLNTEAVVSLKAIAVGVGKVATVLAGIYGAYQLAQQMGAP